MILEALRARIQQLEQKLSELINQKSSAVQKRDNCYALIDELRAFRNSAEEGMNEQYQVMINLSNKVKGAKFRRTYQSQIREILLGSTFRQGMEELEQGLNAAKNASRDSEEEVDQCNRRIRQVEDELSYTRGELMTQEAETNNVGK